MYQVLKTDNTTILQRAGKNGIPSEVCRVMNTVDGRVLLLDKCKIDVYRFKSDTPIKFVIAGSKALAKVTSAVMVYIKPHHLEYHKEIMQQNSRRYYIGTARQYDSVQLDYDGILDNMLEFIAKV